MSKIKLEFNWPEESDDFELFYHGTDFHSSLNEFKERLRYRLKHGELDEKEQEITEKHFNELVDVLNKNEIEKFF